VAATNNALTDKELQDAVRHRLAGFKVPRSGQ
jgi:hypothetical protein